MRTRLTIAAFGITLLSVGVAGLAAGQTATDAVRQNDVAVAGR